MAYYSQYHKDLFQFLLLEEEVLQEIELDIENMTQKEAEQFLKDTIGLPQNFS